MKKLLGIVVLGLLLVGCDVIAKDVKPYLCNYKAGIFENPDLGKTGDPCLEGGASKYKFYVNGKFDAKDEDSCTDFIIDYTNTAEMLMKYPTDDWMVGCDDKW